ncbi:MAG: zf-HC2 domain-containing protein [bacterium]|nr:zf-HC2 domain-containing protein [Gammaproteobacteria bacterium]
MQPEFSCEQCQNLLPEFIENTINTLQKQRVDQHLEQCAQCSETLQQLWELQAMSTRWHDESVPGWSRRRAFFEPRDWWSSLQMVSTFASILVLVFVFSQAQVSTDDGFSIRFGDDPSEKGFLTEATLEKRVAQLLSVLEVQQQEQLQSNSNKLTSQQVATNQLLLKAALDMSRSERREDFDTILNAWDLAQGQRARQTRESLRLLLVNQLEDRRNIEQLNRLFSGTVSETLSEGKTL